ncbi:MAG: MFS transporter [Parvularculaceae bacterium]
MTSLRNSLSYYRPVAALLLGATLLFVGQGVFLILTPLKLAEHGYSTVIISAVGSAYFAGIMTGAWFGDRIVRAFGNVRAYGGFIALIMCAALPLAFFENAITWAAFRFLHGWAAAGAFLAIESWLHAATPNSWRGRVIGAYTALTLVGLGAGQLLINVFGPARVQAINMGAMLFALSIIPVMLSKANAPPLKGMAHRSPVGIYRHSPVAASGCVAAGLLMGAFWSLGPVFASAAGMSAGGVSVFMATVISGGLSLVWLIGRISDRIDRRLVIALSGAAGCAICIFIVQFELVTLARLWPFAFAYGGVIFSLYPLSVSHAADFVLPEEDMLEVTRSLLLANGFGTAMGPMFAGEAFTLLGQEGFFMSAAVVCAGIAFLAIARTTVRPPAAAELRKPFVHVPETTPAGLSMDPRIEDVQQELAFSQDAETKAEVASAEG